MSEKLNLWVFWYNGMTEESSSFPMSYHKTKKGALEAMKAHKEKEYKEYLSHEDWHKKWCEERDFKYRKSKFGSFQSWRVDKFELEILP